MSNIVTLRSPLAPDEVAARLKDQVSSAWALFNLRPMVGWVRERSMRVRRTIFLRNAFQTNLSAEWEADGSGALIRCRYGLFPHVITYVAVFLLGAAGFAWYPLMAMLNGTPAPDGASFLFGTAGFLVFGAVLAMVCLWLARDDRRILTELVARSVEAEVIDR